MRRKRSGKSSFYVVLIVFAIVIIGIVVGRFDDSNSKPVPKSGEGYDFVKDLEKQFSAWDGSHHKTVKYIKDRMKNPKSFKHVKTTYTAHKDKNYRVIMMQYRGKNSFNAVVTHTAFVKVKLNGDVVEIISNL